ncbi:MAG: DinB family protein [Acidobacteria bacterium]|nr:DinB family protein [Acidobacteriota bacterium]
MPFGASQLADSFRTVRKNTVIIAQDIPEDQYGFRAVEGVMSVAEMLAHLAVSTAWAEELHFVERKTEVTYEDFSRYMTLRQEAERALTTKAAIVDALSTKGETFAAQIAAMTDDQLAETVTFPPPVQPPSKTRFEMLLSVKEHEMHHRGQLMLIERLLGIVPHLTRARQKR